MRRERELVALPLTFYLKKEGDQWAALSPEVTVGSCGGSMDEARQGLKDAVETYVLYMLSQGRTEEIARQMSPDEIRDFLREPEGESWAEEHVFLVRFGPGPEGEAPSEASFVRSLLPAHAAQSMAL